MKITKKINKTYFSFTQEYQRELVNKLFETYGIDDLPSDTHLDKYARNIAISVACNSGLATCRNETKIKFSQIINTTNDFHQNVRENLYCASLREANKADFLKVYQRLVDSDDEAYRNMIIKQLACIESKSELEWYLRTALNSTADTIIIYRSGEQAKVLSAIYQSGQTGLELAIAYLHANAADALAAYGKNTFTSILTGIAGRVNEKVSEQVQLILKLK